MPPKPGFENYLVTQNVLSQDQLKAFVQQAQTRKVTLFQVLIESNVVTEEALAQTLSKFHQVEYLPEPINFDPQLVKSIPIFTLRRYRIIPVSKSDKAVTLAMADPGNILATDEVRRLLKLEIKVVCASEKRIAEALSRSQGALPASSSAAAASSAPTDSIGTADKILDGALGRRVSDIHLEPMGSSGIVRERIDGTLYDTQTLPIETFTTIVSRLKLMAGMDVVERRLAQDGRFKFTQNGQNSEIRASIIPTIHGEKMVLRLLRSNQSKPTLEMLALDSKRLSQLHTICNLYEGLVLVAGPTGSGKSTTLYAMLGSVDKKTQNVVTVEDPVEYELERANQIQVNTKIGITFSSMLPNLLRQDPDVMLIGEVRDEETAQMVMRAAISGHLVFSTIHAPDAIETVTRITDMGILPHLINAALKACISQRLLRQLCAKCKKPHVATEAEKKSLQIPLEKEVTIYSAQGCDACHQIGYLGRVVVMEILRLSEQMHQAIVRQEKHRFKEIALAEGFCPMRWHAVERVIRGETSLEELLSNCN